MQHLLCYTCPHAYFPGIDVVAIHHHMTGTEPTVYFLHYWGRGPADKLATAVHAAVDQTSPKSSPRR